MSEAFRALVVDDEALYARAIGRALGREGIVCDVALSAAEAQRRVVAASYGLVLLDHRLPDVDGLTLLPLLLARQPSATVVMITAYHAIPDAVAAIRAGAEDYLVKEASLQPLIERVRELRDRWKLRLAGDGWQEHKRGGLLGRSPGIVQVVEQLQQAAGSPDTTVLLTGETGVGKEVAAGYLHQLSRPSGSRLLTVDCVALPEALAESLLFGHERGAFTGADQMRVGAFEEVRDGTLLLDEIGGMAHGLQGKLLRVLESRVFHRVGSLRDARLRARVVAATNDDLAAKVARGAFRLDLYQRLCVFPIHIPPLRERGDDVLLLADHFRRFFARKLDKPVERIDERAQEHLLAYDYPGNVRELKNVIERAVIVSATGRLEPRHLPPRLLTAQPGGVADSAGGSGGATLDFIPGIDTLESLEQRMIRQAMQRAGNVKAEAARLLGISRFQLLRRLEKYRIGDAPAGEEEAGKP